MKTVSVKAKGFFLGLRVVKKWLLQRPKHKCLIILALSITIFVDSFYGLKRGECYKRTASRSNGWVCNWIRCECSLAGSFLLVNGHPKNIGSKNEHFITAILGQPRIGPCRNGLFIDGVWCKSSRYCSSSYPSPIECLNYKEKANGYSCPPEIVVFHILSTMTKAHLPDCPFKTLLLAIADDEGGWKTFYSETCDPDSTGWALKIFTWNE